MKQNLYIFRFLKLIWCFGFFSIYLVWTGPRKWPYGQTRQIVDFFNGGRVSDFKYMPPGVPINTISGAHTQGAPEMSQLKTEARLLYRDIGHSGRQQWVR